MRLKTHLRTATIFVALVGLIGCATDRRKDIAFHTLFTASGQPNTEAFAAALAIRFPRGTSFSTLQSFVESLGGSCHEREPSHAWCEITTRTKLCAASMLGIDVAVQSGTIEAIKVSAGGLGC